ncbi:MAG: PAS-domain containing protein [Paracoccus sp. (in: a-proteobacteria)]|uniref:PAS-domain containing protein n=1 Tax=Paracoccus sp. TaxID=267 RepID=UPI0026DEF3AF|nr:PAS-domain containing protein [Paracoccus sp. (in: a-proteobacteria)]MDO5632157.1 PAS-domain containing protein [Paracoccus sp. (in: a-proteobacteria)]
METTAQLNDLTRSALNLIGQALTIFDADLRLAVANRPFQDMFELPESLIQPGTTFEDTIRFMVERGEYGPQDDPDAAVAMRVEQARTFQAHYLERQRPNGRWIAVEGAPLAQGGWIAVYTDITATKRQEALLRARSEELSEQVLAHAEQLAAANRELAATNAALQEAQAILTQTEAHTRQVIEMIPAHIAHMDDQFRYTFSNRRLPLVFPGTSAEIVGLTLQEAHGPDAARTLVPPMENALAGDPQVFEMTHPGSGRRIRIALTPDRAGHGVYILSTDVTAEVQAREALSHASKRQLAARLTSGLAHDFGNLLTIILGLQGRLAGADLPPGSAADVQGTLAAARRGVALLERLARISGPRHLSPQPVDLPALLAETAALARPSLHDGTDLTVDCALPEGRLILDPGFLQDSLLNLILNANAAMAGPGRITLESRREGDDWLLLTVTDTGPGFSPEALRRGTEPFFSTKQGQGSGLGLSMVYDQTKLAGGTLRLRNTDSGACISIRLPLRRATPQMVLLAEDDNTIRTSVRDMLTSLGHAVIEAASLAEARAIADLPGLTLILSDLQLGDGSGLDLTGGPLPCVLMTSLPPSDPARLAANCPVLTKPFDAARLAAALAKAISGTMPDV